MGTPCPTALKVKFFTYGVILFKFEAQQFLMFANDRL